MTTHYMEEAAHLCDRLLVMNLGKILAHGSPGALIEEHVGHQVLELRLDRARRQTAIEVLRRHDGLRLEDVEDAIYAFSAHQEWEPLLDAFADYGEDVRLREATLEDVFLQLTGRGLSE